MHRYLPGGTCDRIASWNSRRTTFSTAMTRDPPSGMASRALRAGFTSEDSSCAGSSRSEERRVGKSVSVRVDIGGRRIIKKKQQSNRDRATEYVRSLHK